VSDKLVRENRYDFSGGLNTSMSEDSVSVTELVQATNIRLSATAGGFEPRTGTRRMHAAAIGGGAAVRGLIQWDAPGLGRQIVAVSNGKFYHKITEYGAFTEIVPGLFFNLNPPGVLFATFRASAASAPLRLYMGDNISTRKFDGAALTQIDGVAGVPVADALVQYHTRMFYLAPVTPKNVTWSKVGDAENANTGTPTDGGSAMVDVLTGDAITAFEVIGSSMLIGTEDSLVRFTGHSNDDILIASDTEGVSSTLGPVGRRAIARLDDFAALITDRGLALATETEARIIAERKFYKTFEALDKTVLANYVVGYHRGRREVWFAVAGSGDGGLNKTVYIYSLDLNTLYGPFTYSFGITCFARYEDANGKENIIAGCNDGFVRLMDIGTKDDVLSDGTGGSVFNATAEPAIHLYQLPGTQKSALRMNLDAKITSGSITVAHSFDGEALVNETVASAGAGVRAYRVDLTNSQGKRQRVVFTLPSDAGVQIAGYTLEAYDLGRP
jgi:hypothetical protein